MTGDTNKLEVWAETWYELLGLVYELRGANGEHYWCKHCENWVHEVDLIDTMLEDSYGYKLWEHHICENNIMVEHLLALEDTIDYIEDRAAKIVDHKDRLDNAG